MSLLDALLIGAAQALTLVPGVSRSGITMTIALFLTFKREEGVRADSAVTRCIEGKCLVADEIMTLSNKNLRPHKRFSLRGLGQIGTSSEL